MTKNGVAAGAAVQLAGVDVCAGQLRHRFGRQRRRRDAVGDPARQRAEHHAQRVRAVEFVVAVGGDHERRQRLDPARQQPDDVERRLVGPVQVLEHDDRGPSAARPRARRPACRASRLRPRAPRARRPPPRRCRPAGRAGAACTARRRRPTGPACRPSQNVRTSAVLPIPASPATSTNRPRLCSRTASWRASSSSSCAARSRSVTGTILAGTSQPRKRAAYSPASPVVVEVAAPREAAHLRARERVDQLAAARAAAARS